MADTLSFQDAERIIRENPKQADALAFEWHRFLKTYAQLSPELYSIDTSEDFYKWAQEHPGVDTSAWDKGKQISDAYYYLRDQHEDSQMRDNGAIDRSAVPQALAEVPLLAAAFLEKPKIMENDRNYQRIEEELKKEWLKNNPGKDFSSKEGLDYLHGSLDNRADPSLKREAEISFRNNPKFKEKIERYDKEAKKIYKKKEDDPKIWLHEHDMQKEINFRLELLEKTKDRKIKMSKEDVIKSQEQITERVHRKYLREFAEKYPEKTKAYHERIKADRARREGKVEARSNISAPNSQGRSASGFSMVNQAGQIHSPSQSFGRRISPKMKSLNKFIRGLNPLSKLGSRAAARVAGQAVLRGFTAFLMGPAGVVILTILLIVGLTFIIVISGVAPTTTPDSNNQTTNSSQ